MNVCSQNASNWDIGTTCWDCGHTGMVHPGVHTGFAACLLCELAAIRDELLTIRDEAVRKDGTMMNHELEKEILGRFSATVESIIMEAGMEMLEMLRSDLVNASDSIARQAGARGLHERAVQLQEDILKFLPYDPEGVKSAASSAARALCDVLAIEADKEDLR